MVLYPQTGEQEAVARRVKEIGAGEYLKDDTAEGIKAAVKSVLGSKACAQAARKCSDEFRACPGTAGAAVFIENAPHSTDAPDPLKEINRVSSLYMLAFRTAMILLAVLIFIFAGWKFIWIPLAVMGVFSAPLGKAVSQYVFRKKYRRQTV